MCTFEISHLLPMLVIALAYASPSRFSLAGSITILVASFVGLLSGQHVHTEHFVEYSVFDACTLYAATLIGSAVRLAQLSIRKLFANA